MEELTHKESNKNKAYEKHMRNFKNALKEALAPYSKYLPSKLLKRSANKQRITSAEGQVGGRSGDILKVDLASKEKAQVGRDGKQTERSEFLDIRGYELEKPHKVSFSLYFPESDEEGMFQHIDGNRLLLGQRRACGTKQNKPSPILWQRYDEGKMIFGTSNEDGNQKLGKIPVESNVWYDFEYEVTFSSNPDKGKAKISVNGETIVDYNGVLGYQNQTSRHTNFFKGGQYRDGNSGYEGDSTIYFGDYSRELASR